jgi:hypothetical protein
VTENRPILSIRTGWRTVPRHLAVRRALGDALYRVEERHGLDARTLFGEQRRLTDLDRWGLAPTPAEYLATVAEPLAARLRQTGQAVIDHHLDALAGIPLDPESQRVLAASWPAPRRLHAVGDRWHGRLRRAAIRDGAGELLLAPAGETSRRLGRLETVLAGRTPWVHGDLLLRTFEAAWSEVGRHLRVQVERRCEGDDGSGGRRLARAVLQAC